MVTVTKPVSFRGKGLRKLLKPKDVTESRPEPVEGWMELANTPVDRLRANGESKGTIRASLP